MSGPLPTRSLSSGSLIGARTSSISPLGTNPVGGGPIRRRPVMVRPPSAGTIPTPRFLTMQAPIEVAGRSGPYTLVRSSTDPFQTAAALLRFGEEGARTAQPGQGRRAEQGIITSGRVIPSGRAGPSIAGPTSNSNRNSAIPNAISMPVRRVIRRKESYQSSSDRPSVAAERLLKEAKILQNTAPPGCHAAPKSDDLFEWAAVIEGPADTVYEGGTFFCNIIIPTNYPFNPPRVEFLTRIYHCNINAQGEVCVDLLSDKWNSTMTINTVLMSILSLMFDCNPEDALVVSIGKQYRESREEFEKTARIWTKRYAT
uniref:E2 ubiquitin-conjugating enzyme n=1 Tax=Heterorhabditis bacteriophora TaxID=37862 RepID=A0A1I7XQP4_HETBA